MVAVGCAAAGAIEPGPAVLAVGAGVGVAGAEFLLRCGVRDAVPDVAEAVFRVSDELVAGEKLAPGGDGHVLRAAAAAGDALVDAGAVLEVYHVVVEGDGPALAPAAEHFLRQQLILLAEDGEVLLGERAGVVGRADDGLHAQLREAQVGHVEEVAREVGIVVRVGAAHVVALVPALCDEALEIGHDARVAPVPGGVHAEAVVHLGPPVEGEDDVVHLAVAEVRDLVVEQDAVRREGEAEVLSGVLFNGARVGDEVLDDLPVHERLAAEEVHLKVPARAGVLDEEIERALADLETHERPLAVVLALAGEAVGTAEVAGVGDMETEGLYDPGRALVVRGELLVVVGGEELAVFFKLRNVIEALKDVPARDLGVFCTYLGAYFVSGAGLVHIDYVIGYVVHEVDGAGGGVEDDVVAIELVLVDQSKKPLSESIKRRRLAGRRRRIQREAITSSRRAGWQRRSWSCRQTGRRSGTRRSRRS